MTIMEGKSTGGTLSLSSHLHSGNSTITSCCTFVTLLWSASAPRSLYYVSHFPFTRPIRRPPRHDHRFRLCRRRSRRNKSSTQGIHYFLDERAFVVFRLVS
jgi:hypothetical protein